MRKNRKYLTAAFLAAVLAVVLLLSAGITQALLQDSTVRINHINLVGDSVSAVLLEPEWDGVINYTVVNGEEKAVYEYRDNGSGAEVPVYGYAGGSYDSPVFDPDDPSAGTRASAYSNGAARSYGIDRAVNMIPGSSSPKDPYIVNTSEEMPVWAAVKVTFVYAGAGGMNASKKGIPLNASDMLRVSQIIEIDYNSDSDEPAWERISQGVNGGAADAEQVFCFKQRLDPGVRTDRLFTAVSLKESASSADVAFLKGIGGFAVYVEGFAMQGNRLTDYQSFRQSGVNGAIVFPGTPSAENPLSL